MERQRVSSSNLYSIGYDETNQILEIEFKNNSVYQYFAVPIREYQNLMNASSLGVYFANYIRSDYRYKEIY